VFRVFIKISFFLFRAPPPAAPSFPVNRIPIPASRRMRPAVTASFGRRSGTPRAPVRLPPSMRIYIPDRIQLDDQNRPGRLRPGVPNSSWIPVYRVSFSRNNPFYEPRKRVRTAGNRQYSPDAGMKGAVPA
jgi:hypothetical protein